MSGLDWLLAGLSLGAVVAGVVQTVTLVRDRRRRPSKHAPGTGGKS